MPSQDRPLELILFNAKVITFDERQPLVEEDDLYVWIRRFESEDDRVRLYEDVYESDTWKNEIAPKIPDMMNRDKIVVTRLESTSASVLQ